MLLFDIGNSYIKSYENGIMRSVSIEQFNILPKDKKFYYINVNHKVKEKLKQYKNGIDLEQFFNLKTNYNGLGIDRKAVCIAVKDGVVVDAGSAITIDVMSDGKHKGGCILPGLVSYEKSFATISPALSYKIDKNIAIETLPNSTKEAISFAAINSIRLLIKEIAKDKKVYFTGGDGKLFSKHFENTLYIPTLVFDGMINVIKENGC